MKLAELIEAPIIGAGGGGKGGSGGGGLSEQSDSLKSTSYAQVLDLISEGEIGGLVDGLKSIYLDGVPIQNADGSYNFTGVTYASTNGTQTQGVIAGYDETRSEFSVGVEVKVGTGPIARSISNANVTSVVVTVQIPALTFLDAQGNLGGSSVNFAIDVQVNGGGWVEKINDTITGKSSGAYQRQYRIVLPAGATRNVRVRRITVDSASASLNNKTFFQSYSEIIDAKLSYPNSALIGLKVDASQFRSIPVRGFDVKLLKVRFPTNATVRADGSLSYTGTWDGTFQVGWCADPAWAFYDVITMNRYGLGDYLGTNPLSKWECYTISKYCAELVPDGFGGTEPRFSCHVWINTRQEAFKLLSDLTSCFRGMSYWSSGQISLVQDAPKDPSYLFTNANVVDGLFRYEGSSAKARHSVALVTYNDPADLYRQKIEYVEDSQAISRYGVIPTEVVAFGCASRGQAARVGRWLLYSERSETEVVTFSTGGEGAMCRPGDIVKIADQHRAGIRQGGRVVSATASAIVVDALASVPAAGSTLYVLGADGIVQQRTTGTATGTTIPVTTSLSPIPPAGAVWVVATAAVDAQTFRVLSVTETDTGEHEVIALAHNPSKFAAIETGLVLQPRQITTLNPIPGAPGAITFSQSIVSIQGVPQLRLTARWSSSTKGIRYTVEWRKASGNWQQDETVALEYDINGATVDTYDFRITAQNYIGTPSAPITGSYTITASALTAALAAYQASTTAGAIVGQGDLATTNRSSLPFGMGNRVRFSMMEKGTQGWQCRYNPSGLSITSLAALDVGGGRAVKLSWSFTGAGQVVSLGTALGAAYAMPVTAGETIAVTYGVETLGAVAARSVVVGFYDASGSSVGSVNLVDSGTTILGFASLYRSIITVPAGAVSAWLEVYTSSSGAGAASIAITQPMMIGVGAGQAVYPAFSPGPSNEYGADVTVANTAAGVVGQSAWATYSTLTPAQVAQLQPNMIYNPTGVLNLDGWNVWSGSFSGIKGNYNEGYYFWTTTGTNAIPPQLYQDVPVAGGATYTLSADIYAAGISVSSGVTNARAYIQWIDGSGGHAGYSATAQVAAGNGWTHVTAIGQVAPATAVKARVWIDVFGTGTWSISAVAWSKLKLQLGTIDTLFTDDASYGARYQSGVSIESLKPAQVNADRTNSNVAAGIIGQGTGATASTLAAMDPAAAALLSSAAAGASKVAMSGSVISLFMNAGATLTFNGQVSTNAGGSSGSLKCQLQSSPGGANSWSTFATGAGASVGATEPGTDTASGSFTNSTGVAQVFDFRVNPLRTPGTAGGTVITSQSFIST